MAEAAAGSAAPATTVADGRQAAGASNSAPAAASEAPAKAVPDAPPTLEIMAQFLEDYVARKASGARGWFLVHDPEASSDIPLHLVRVYRDRLVITADKTLVVSVDFKTAEGKSYDVDLWVNQTPQGLVVIDSTIRKVDGVPRYLWMEQEDHWELVPV
jgi:hypothetical protein